MSLLYSGTSGSCPSQLERQLRLTKMGHLKMHLEISSSFKESTNYFVKHVIEGLSQKACNDHIGQLTHSVKQCIGSWRAHGGTAEQESQPGFVISQLY
ncbi:hypothetical protein Anapl_02134 [Anas platyrhynchos]|uniref:Uncharacterized protein n=1 Tax=Anas platyrhynchos TaxID=8839 RepID=R0LHN4_ANAPL|nr:hypothetical protein Anapl_02134 [Anas platyrhynchos]